MGSALKKAFLLKGPFCTQVLIPSDFKKSYIWGALRKAQGDRVCVEFLIWTFWGVPRVTIGRICIEFELPLNSCGKARCYSVLDDTCAAPGCNEFYANIIQTLHWCKKAKKNKKTTNYSCCNELYANFLMKTILNLIDGNAWIKSFSNFEMRN